MARNDQTSLAAVELRNKTCFAFNVFSKSWCRSLTWAETASVKEEIITSSTLEIPAKCTANFCSWGNLDSITSNPDLSKILLRFYSIDLTVLHPQYAWPMDAWRVRHY
jgi:hypothetical protein